MAKSDVYCMDCMAFMRGIDDGCFDLAIADPPYGLPARSSVGGGKLRDRVLARDDIHVWDRRPDDGFFRELMRVSKQQVIWGMNYFTLPPTRCVAVWDKMQPWQNFSQADVAWTSFDRPSVLFRGRCMIRGRIHPTEKPLDLYEWLLDVFGGAVKSVFDPMMGSQVCRVACARRGLDFTGCEASEEYFRNGCERFEREAGCEYFTPGPVLKQLEFDFDCDEKGKEV